VIPFERNLLFEFTETEETELEQFESIDMLRLLENSEAVRLVETTRQTDPVDTPKNHQKVKELMFGGPLFKSIGTKLTVS
jgi:3-deoxy-manno-octulosonate cytidylyltransferase (CMP-KDO synthetase)